MAKDLIEVPDFNPNSVFYLSSIDIYENGQFTNRVYNPRELFYRWYNPTAKECIKFFSKFIFKSYVRHYGEHVKKSRRKVRDDPLQPLWKVQKKYPKLNYKKFISKKNLNLSVYLGILMTCITKWHI